MKKYKMIGLKKRRRGRGSDLVRDMETPMVLGYELDGKTLTPKRGDIDLRELTKEKSK